MRHHVCAVCPYLDRDTQRILPAGHHQKVLTQRFLVCLVSELIENVMWKQKVVAQRFLLRVVSELIENVMWCEKVITQRFLLRVVSELIENVMR